MKIISFIILLFGLTGLILPVFLPPIPVYPSFLSFVPIAFFVACAVLARSRSEGILVLCILAPALILGTWFRFDTIRFNLIFSWQVCSYVLASVAFVQLALSAALLSVLIRRRLKH